MIERVSGRVSQCESEGVVGREKGSEREKQWEGGGGLRRYVLSRELIR